MIIVCDVVDWKNYMHPIELVNLFKKFTNHYHFIKKFCVCLLIHME